MQLWRMANVKHSPLDGQGAAETPGRWHEIGTRVVYVSQTRAGSLLETLARSGIGTVPRNRRQFCIEIPDGISQETFPIKQYGTWRANESQTKSFGSKWAKELRSCLLFVPSYIVEGEFNALLNPLHKEFQKISAGPPEQVFWDRRIFGKRS